MTQQTLFKVRDLRKKDQFKIDDVYLNGYARICGVNATLVYLSLCRHAEFESQKAYPSQSKIAFELGVSVASVKRGIKELIGHNIVNIQKEKMRGKFDNNIYYLLDKSEWKKPTIAPPEPRINHSSKSIAHQPPTAGDPQKDNTQQRITHTKDNKELLTAEQVGGKDVLNNIELLSDYFIALKGTKERHNRYLKAAGDLLVLCENNMIKAKEKLDNLKKWAEKEGMEYEFETAIKRFFYL